MRTPSLLSLASAFVCGFPLSGEPIAADESDSRPSPVVVELFTSQGCSSCPPADAVLARIAEWSEQRGKPVHVLSMHVDYWNSLGWADPYSSRAYSNRQRRYARGLSGRVYTPQMVVNGQVELVGSRGAEASRAIENALRQAAGNAVNINVKESNTRGTLEVSYSVTGDTKGKALNLAVVQTRVGNEVPRGENAGRSLSHVHVVRALRTAALNAPTGTVGLELPGDLPPRQAKVIAYVQHQELLKISGATAESVVAVR